MGTMRMHLAVMITVMSFFGFCGFAVILGSTGLGSGKSVDLRFARARKRQRYSHQLSEFAPQGCMQAVDIANPVDNFDIIP